MEKIQADTVERWDVLQSEITVTYRFAEPQEPAAIVLPRADRLDSRNQPPETLQTLGDPLKRRRLNLKLLQQNVAEKLSVHTASLRNWEVNRTKPELVYMPAIIRFLGYNPLPPARNWAAKLTHGRTALGLTQKQAAQQIGVDASTLARWERGEREPTGLFLAKVTRFLGVVEKSWSQETAQTA